jgi:hypothetical protein
MKVFGQKVFISKDAYDRPEVYEMHRKMVGESIDRAITGAGYQPTGEMTVLTTYARQQDYVRDSDGEPSSMIVACTADKATMVVLEVKKSGEPELLCPECVQGKHINCAGMAFHPETDEIVDCACTHQ